MSANDVTFRPATRADARVPGASPGPRTQKQSKHEMALLQPFPTKGTTTGRSAGARRALGLVLRGDAHFKKVLLKAHPGVCGAGGGVY